MLCCVVLYAAQTWPRWAPPPHREASWCLSSAWPFQHVLQWHLQRTAAPRRPGWLTISSIFDTPVSQLISHLGERAARYVWILCVYSVCAGGHNTVRRRWIESRFIHHCDSWSRSNTTFQVTSWSHFWRMSCEVTLGGGGGGSLRIPRRTRNTHVCPQTPIWLWNVLNWYKMRSKSWSFLVFFVFFFTHTTRSSDRNILRQIPTFF